MPPIPYEQIIAYAIKYGFEEALALIKYLKANKTTLDDFEALFTEALSRTAQDYLDEAKKSNP